jgi:hypothetical protein
MAARTKIDSTHFKTIVQSDVPQGRKGKHREIVATILKDLDKLKDGSAIKVPLVELDSSKERVRSALNRATRKAGLNVATATDGNFLYIWNATESLLAERKSDSKARR